MSSLSKYNVHSRYNIKFVQVSSRFELEVSQYLTLSVKYPISLNRWSQLSVFTLKMQCVEVGCWSKYVLKSELEVSQYLTLSVKYPISLNRWSQLSVFTLKIQCAFEVQYWSKYVPQVRVRSVSVSHSFSQISYLFEPLESTECLHSQDTMSFEVQYWSKYVLKSESEVSQYLTLSVKYPISLNRWSQLSVFTPKIQCLFEVQYWSKYVPELESEVSQYLTLSVKYPISLNRWSQLSVFTPKIQCLFEVQYWSNVQIRVRSVSVSHSFSQIVVSVLTEEVY